MRLWYSSSRGKSLCCDSDDLNKKCLPNTCGSAISLSSALPHSCTCAPLDLHSQAFMPKLVEKTLDRVLNCIKDKELTALFELLLFLHEQGAISSTDLISGLATYTVQLEDLR